MNLLAYICFFSIMFFSPAFSPTGVYNQVKKTETGTASYYGAKFQGRLMANGKKFDQNRLTAAHNKLPLGTFVRVRNLRNNKTVIVEITDRMHHKNKRLIDLSKAAALELNFVRQGLTKVQVDVVGKPDNNQQ